jgi:hypothetical protein
MASCRNGIELGCCLEHIQVRDGDGGCRGEVGYQEGCSKQTDPQSGGGKKGNISYDWSRAQSMDWAEAGMLLTGALPTDSYQRALC